MGRLFVRLQGATTGASLCDVTIVATQKTDAKTSRLVCHLTEIALSGEVCQPRPRRSGRDGRDPGARDSKQWGFESLGRTTMPL